MGLLDALAEFGTDQLWWKMIHALSDVGDEIEQLERRPRQVRDLLYGRDVLQDYYDLRDDLAELITEDISDAPANHDPRATTTHPDKESA